MLPKRPGKIIVFLALGLTFALFLLSKSEIGILSDHVAILIAQAAALGGTVLFAFSFIIASRTHLVEDAFGGLDYAYGFHHKTGVWSFSLLIVHLIGILVGYGANGAPLLSLMTSHGVFIAGEIGLVLMAGIALTIIFAKIKYQFFVIVQKLFVIPYAFGIYHLLFVQSDISRYWPLRFFLFIVVGLGLIAWIYREFLYRLIGPHAFYTVKSVEDKGAGIVEMTLEPKGKPLAYRAGQFAYFSFRSGDLPQEPHPFSFASSPDEPVMRFAAKALGDYTKQLKLAKQGDIVAVYGPYGKFFENLDPAAGNIFIAGGIGVTPLLSVVRGRRPCADAAVVYTTRSESDCVYNQEIFTLSENGRRFRYLFHESDRRGFLSADIVEKRAGGLENKNIYLCGPTPMMKSLALGLTAKGVPKHRIIFETFSY